MKIAITTSSFAKFDDTPLQMLQQNNIEYVFNTSGGTLQEDATIALLQGCHGVIAGTEQLNSTVLAALPMLKVISRCGVGMDNVDKDAAKEHEIAVFNTPDAPTQATAEYTLALMLTMLRNTAAMDADMRQGQWKKRMGFLLHAKKVGIIGMGRIGRRVGSLISAFGAQVACADPFATETPYPKMEMNELLAWADIITLHCSKPAENKALISNDELKRMHQGSWVVNAARGGLIDEDALLEALQSKHLAGAALDVYSSEPYKGALVSCPQIVLSPHAASYAQEGRVEMEIQATKNLLLGLGYVKQ